MSFDVLPPDLLIEIFHQLPFKDRVRLAGVNRSFRDASDESITRMKSLDVTDSLVTYSIMTQSFSSLLESSSSTLESIIAIDHSCNKFLIRAIAEFVYPKLKHLEIAVTNNAQTKKVISQSPNLSSLILRLSREFEWPENVVFEKLENLEIHCQESNYNQFHVNLGIGVCLLTLRPLIGNVPNLKRLTIKNGSKTRGYFLLCAQEISQLLASTPYLEQLDLQLNHYVDRLFMDMCRDITAAIPTWQLPKLTTLAIDFGSKQQIPSSTLSGFSTLFPRLHLRSLCLYTGMNWTDLIDLVTNIPSLSVLKIWEISDGHSTYGFVKFLTSTAGIFHRNLQIRFYKMPVSGRKAQIEQMKAVLEEMKNNGGPVVQMDSSNRIRQIRYTVRPCWDKCSI